jgi:hypothetical protein
VILFLPYIVTLPAAAEFMINYMYTVLYMTFIPVQEIKSRHLEQTSNEQFESIMFHDTFTTIMFIILFLTALVIITNAVANLTL